MQIQERQFRVNLEQTHLFKMFENVGQGARNDAAIVVSAIANNGISFAAAGLTISKDGAVVAREHTAKTQEDAVLTKFPEGGGGQAKVRVTYYK